MHCVCIDFPKILIESSDSYKLRGAKLPTCIQIPKPICLIRRLHPACVYPCDPHKAHTLIRTRTISRRLIKAQRVKRKKSIPLNSSPRAATLRHRILLLSSPSPSCHRTATLSCEHLIDPHARRSIFFLFVITCAKLLCCFFIVCCCQVRDGSGTGNGGDGGWSMRPMDSEQLRECGHRMVDFIADYYKSIETFPVLSQVQARSLLTLLQILHLRTVNGLCRLTHPLAFCAVERWHT
jgi:hypothetical protein